MSDRFSASMRERDMRLNRRHALSRQVLYRLSDTIILRGLTADTDVENVRADWSTASEVAIAPLVEAIDILEAIIFASDGCMGHRECAHSMEPWQCARALLAGKWDSEEPDGKRWPPLPFDYPTCDGYVLSAPEAPYCPSCARARKAAERASD